MMKTSLLAAIVALSFSTGAWAIEPPASVPAASKPPTGKTATKAAASTATAAAETPPPAAPNPTPPPANTLDDYVVELVAMVNLSDKEKQEIHDLYTADGVALQKILNDESLSPLQKAQQVSDLRDTRNDKIEHILHDVDRQYAFLQVEAGYRVALTEYAADGGLVPPPPPAPPAPAPAAAPAPASAPATNAPPAKPAPPVVPPSTPPASQPAKP
jgi:hypothetical protein